MLTSILNHIDCKVLLFKKYSGKVNPNINILKILIFRIHTREKQTWNAHKRETTHSSDDGFEIKSKYKVTLRSKFVSLLCVF